VPPRSFPDGGSPSSSDAEDLGKSATSEEDGLAACVAHRQVGTLQHGAILERGRRGVTASGPDGVERSYESSAISSGSAIQ
jgi:hypothetical protein